MPLRAVISEKTIHAFELAHEEWMHIKSTHKHINLLMPCCSRKAIPKTSRLGTQYFAHAKKGNCISAPETKEHIYLKSLVANAAKRSGWDVITEYSGVTPDGEKWIADVFCFKGNAKIVFEIQWSHQGIEEYQRRAKKYAESGIRSAWLFRLQANKDYFDYSITIVRTLFIIH
ncbi:MAG: hypothetical protein HAW67_00805 [Endozoicomonadaceae bacterium]|nr:hypothetical protein [Endozoicomonadaceae bacterium]